MSPVPRLLGSIRIGGSGGGGGGSVGGGGAGSDGGGEPGGVHGDDHSHHRASVASYDRRPQFCNEMVAQFMHLTDGKDDTVVTDICVQVLSLFARLRGSSVEEGLIGEGLDEGDDDVETRRPFAGGAGVGGVGGGGVGVGGVDGVNAVDAEEEVVRTAALVAEAPNDEGGRFVDDAPDADTRSVVSFMPGNNSYMSVNGFMPQRLRWSSDKVSKVRPTIAVGDGENPGHSARMQSSRVGATHATSGQGIRAARSSSSCFWW